MTTIVTRAGKGSPLTNTEVDDNFTNLNTAKIETLTSTDTSVTITGTGSSRDLSVPVNPNVVSGPASATDNAVARFDGTTGKLVQNSTAATIDDSGNADFLSQKADYFDIDTAATTSAAVGRVRWDATKGTAVLGEVGGNLEAALGQTLDAYVTNAETVTINKGQPVYLFSAIGDRASVKLAYNTSDATSAKTFGIAAESITAGQTGLIRCRGVLEGLDLGSYTAGDTLYLGATAGTLTATKPSAPNHLVYIGVVERANNGNGQLYITVQNGYELDEIHDVQITTPANGNLLIRDQTNSLWKNALLTEGTGVTITNAAASVTVAIGQAVATSSNVQFNSLGVGTAGSTVTGEIRATNNITSFYSSDRQFKENIETIPNALESVESIGGKLFDWTDAYLEAHGGEDDYFIHKADFGVIAQDVQAVFPRAVRSRPDGSLAVDYEKLVALAFAAIVELSAEVKALKEKG